MSISRAVFDEVMVPCYNPMDAIMDKGKGSRLWDTEGKEYVDFAAGIAVSCLGHCHPVMVDAIQKQSQKIWHLSNTMTNEPALRLAQKLVEKTFADKVFFANSGAEANEAALKLARRWAHERFGDSKNEIIAFTQGFHGRTFFTVTVGGQAAYSDGFGPKPQGITHLPFNDVDALRSQISERTCAIILEPIQAEGGIINPTSEFIQAARELCNEHNALLIFDEVQTGNGRTGNLYAYQGLNVTPDILTTAKAMGGGIPIGAMLTTKELAIYMKVGTHGSTYGGNPLACAVSLAVMEEISKPDFLEGVKRREQLFRKGLETINAKYGIFDATRGQGLLIGAPLIASWHGRAREILVQAGKEGLLVLIAGPNVMRMTPALNIPEADIAEGFVRLDRAIGALV